MLLKTHRFHCYCLLLITGLVFFLSLPALAMPPAERVTLENGLRLVISSDHSLPFVTFQMIIDGGSRLDPRGREGLSYITAKGLLHGTLDKTAQEINHALDFIGASLLSSSSSDYTSISLRILKKDLDKGFSLFMDAVTQPVFPEDEFKHEVQKTLGMIKSREEDPGTFADMEFQKGLFGTAPYAHPVTGTEESISVLTRKDVESFHNTHIRPNNAILVIAGDITMKETRQGLMKRLETWEAKPASVSSFELPPVSGIRILTADRSITQANIILGNAGPPRNNPDFFPMVVMNYILGGGGFSSRIFTEVREKRGLAYSVYSSFEFWKYAGSFTVSLQTKNPSAREAISVILEQMRKIQKESVTDRELDGAHRYLTGSFPLRLDTQAKIAGFLARIEFYGLGENYGKNYASRIRAVTKEDIRRVALKYLQPENYVLVVIANLTQAGFGGEDQESTQISD